MKKLTGICRCVLFSLGLVVGAGVAVAQETYGAPAGVGDPARVAEAG